MGRFSIRNSFYVLLILLGIFYIYYLNQWETKDAADEHQSKTKILNEGKLENLTCVLNREVAKNIGIKHSNKNFQCKTDGSEVFVPFSFLNHNYEIRGNLVNNDREFEISHSYSKVYSPQSQYSATGQFMHFKTFNVEGRSRVKCVSARAGVPVSTQWSQAGYFYPTQIAQFALSHFSSHVANKNKNTEDKTVIEDDILDKVLTDKAAAGRVIDEESQSLVIEFKDTLDIHVNTKHPIVCLDLKNLNGAGFQIIVKSESSDETFQLHYLPLDDFLKVENNKVIFGFGSDSTGEWIRFTRDVTVDIEKVFNLKKKSRKVSKMKLKIVLLQFFGHGQAANISFSSDEHLRMFFHGADWFLNNQDGAGGWPSHVVFNKDRKKYPGAEEVRAGWYGAMCQGQAISVLVRAWSHSQDRKYLQAALQAVKVFSVPSSQGGVKAVFLDKYPWYEEYPTNPPTFILNGFMYSLLGLFDLRSVSSSREVSDLYQAGLQSLAALLPLYDSGASTFYDLRHFTMKTAPKGARWDYHSTHINQLLTLYTVEKNFTIFRDTAERWRGYMIGQRSPHN